MFIHVPRYLLLAALGGALLAAGAGPVRTPVLVELFTSEGCDSCPPADKVLEALDSSAIVLSEHVDYWDHLGWRDPFSSRQYTLRQMAYVRSFSLSSAYTPQAVVGGSREMVGSRADALRAAIAEASNRKPEGSVRIAINGGTANVRAETPQGRDLVIVAFEDGATTQVASGENAGQTIANDSIVRQITRVSASEANVALPANASGVAAFLQDPKTMRIYAATAARTRR